MESNDWYDAERRVERAAELFEQCRWHEALEELRAATSLNPYNPVWLYNLGLTLDQLGRHDEAIDAYRQAIEIEPNDLASLQRLGADLHQIGRYKESIATLENVQRIDATYEPSYCGRILSYAELGEHQLAEEMFYTARLYKDQCPHCYYNIAVSLYARKQYDKAIHCWQQAIDLDSSYPQAHLCIAEAYWRCSELELARQHYLHALRQEPGDTAALLDLAQLLEEMGRSDEAGEKIRRAVELSPEDPASHCSLGRWLLNREQYAPAEVSLRRAIGLDPTHPGVHLLLARLFQHRRQLNEARRQLRAELLLRPQNPQILMDLANHLVDLGDTRPALACFKRLTQIEPYSGRAWQNLAVVQFMRGRFDEGIGSSHEALHCDPDNVSALHNLAMALGKMGDFDEALAQLRLALARAPRDVTLHRLDLRLRVQRFASRVRGLFRRILRR